MTSTLVERKDRETIVRPSGDLVTPRIEELRTTLRSLVAEGGREITLDFSDVNAVDSAGLSLVIAAHNSLVKVGGRLRLVRTSKDILDLLSTLRIQQHFAVSGDCPARTLTGER